MWLLLLRSLMVLPVPSLDALRDQAAQQEMFFSGWTPWHWLILLIPFVVYAVMEWVQIRRRR